MRIKKIATVDDSQSERRDHLTSKIQERGSDQDATRATRGLSASRGMHFKTRDDIHGLLLVLLNKMDQD